MKKISAYIILMALIMPILSVSAQKRNQKAKANVEDVDPRIERMVASTQEIVFIDSMVIDKNKFLEYYNLNPESGRLLKYDDFFGGKEHANSYVHVNEMGNKCYFSIEDTINGGRLYTSDILDNRWTQGTELQGIREGEKIESVNYPFMMADGITLYFAAKGTESIGGYDIFVTRLDIESGQYLKPENIGMPFNSEANDYMYAIDELDSIGWFVTDRNQTDGKVCVYMFIPSDTRQTYSPDEYPEDKIKSLARIERIADTWKDGKAREKALKRLASITNNKQSEKKNGEFAFVINDNTTYKTLKDFRSADNAGKYAELISQKAKLDNLGKAIAKARDYFAAASNKEKDELRSEFLKSEKQYESMETQIENLEKEIRNAENKLLK